jgi:UDP-N-acetylglucosamine 1-carboxyvinyltransferase
MSENFYFVQESQLSGTVRLSGAKNSALKLLSASLLTDGPVTLLNYPDNLLDAQIHVEMLKILGKKCMLSEGKITIREGENHENTLLWQGRSIRNTLLILGALVAKTGNGSVPLPGGCNLGDRKFDLHEMVLKTLGANVWIEKEMLCASADKGLKGADIFLPIRSTGATENAIICGTLAKGITRVWNPHIRPEILDLIKFLISIGAKIRIFGQEHIEITGVEQLNGTTYTILPDNMEAITWMIASVITHGDVEIVNFPVRDLEVPLIHLRESGAKYFEGVGSLIVRGGTPYPVEISTGPYPGINSDMQPLFAVYAACARGQSRIVDLRFPDRYGYAEELGKMGMKFSLVNNILHIDGGVRLKGARVTAPDLRGGTALALAGLVADGETCIADSWQIERGYDNFVKKLQSLGGNISYG